MLIDVVAGIIISLGVAHIFEIPIVWWWVLSGALFALLPDLDFFIEFFQRGTVGGKKLGSHRVLTHVPLLFVIPAVLLYVFVGTPLAILFVLCILWHFAHDIQGMGYGYRLLYPFSTRFYKFFSDKEGNYQYNLRHFVTSWSKSEVQALHEKHGNDHWIKDHLRHHASKWQTSVVVLLRYCLVVFIILFTIATFISP